MIITYILAIIIITIGIILIICEDVNMKLINILVIVYLLFMAYSITLLFFNMESRADTIDYSTITISDSEYHDVVRVVAGESQSDTYESQLAVVEVIFNRCLDPRFNDTPYSVVSEKGQFSVWKMRYDSWIEPEYGEKPLNELLTAKESKILNNKEYVLFSTKKMKYGYDYIKIGKTYFGKLK